MSLEPLVKICQHPGTVVDVSPTLMSAPRVTKLPPNGPKPGQSVSSWLYGKDKAHDRATQINQKP
jgi:hypothetical protein